MLVLVLVVLVVLVVMVLVLVVLMVVTDCVARCVVCRDGVAVEMSFDHKPEDDVELRRIRGAGGKVTPDGRVNGGLNLSRAIGGLQGIRI